MSVEEKLKEAKLKLQKAREEYEELSRNIFTENTQEIFKDRPWLLGFTWGQGTPGYCDGDPCYFHVNSDADSITLVLDESIGEEATGGILENAERYDLYHEENRRIVTHESTQSYYDPHTRSYIREPYTYTSEEADSVLNPGADIILPVYEEVSILLSSVSSSVLQDVFGDPAEVTIKRDGTHIIEDYDVGY